MTMQLTLSHSARPLTAAVEREMRGDPDDRFIEDLLYLERWELHPLPGPAAASRVSQIRRANPALAVAIRDELATLYRHKVVNGYSNSQ
jgi:hypothetical protein